ncbi:MAG TPA: hypothetical protein VF622_15890 [Segetibacter sp.]|jgi:hypothetical protein
MGLFNFFNNKNRHTNGVEIQSLPNNQPKPEILENVFIENAKPVDNAFNERTQVQSIDNGIYFLYQFLEKNHEAKGYDDALVNPDNTHLEQNVESLKSDLERTIRKVKTFYEDSIREINFHISSRGRSGMIDTVEELTMKKETAETHLNQVEEIKDDAINNRGLGQGIIISYTRGFRNGLAAISHHSILRRNF